MRSVEYGAATIVDQLRSLELKEPGAAAAAVYDRPIGLRLLYEEPTSGEEHSLVRYPAGVRGRLHRHAAAHTIVVLEGRLDANGQVIGPGSYAHFPTGEPMRHQATEDGPCLLARVKVPMTIDTLRKRMRFGALFTPFPGPKRPRLVQHAHGFALDRQQLGVLATLARYEDAPGYRALRLRRHPVRSRVRELQASRAP